jgi:Gas vesicle synthesis protein GvpL/GvpF
MSAPSETQDETTPQQATGCYVYGLLPGDVELNSEIQGIGDPPATVRLARAGDDLAALVSDADLSRPLGTPDDLQAHKEILDAIVVGAPVLPVRFGTVLTDEDAVVSELLEPHRDEFAEALDELEGTAEYVIHGRYVEQAILAEILSENAQAAQLADQVRGGDPDATRDLRIGLGELINDAVAAKREKDTRQLLPAIADHCRASLIRQPTHELDAVYVAVLAELDKADELGKAVGDLASEWQERMELQLLGPMAPYDFVGDNREAQG